MLKSLTLHMATKDGLNEDGGVVQLVGVDELLFLDVEEYFELISVLIDFGNHTILLLFELQ